LLNLSGIADTVRCVSLTIDRSEYIDELVQMLLQHILGAEDTSPEAIRLILSTFTFLRAPREESRYISKNHSTCKFTCSQSAEATEVPEAREEAGPAVRFGLLSTSGILGSISCGYESLCLFLCIVLYGAMVREEVR